MFKKMDAALKRLSGMVKMYLPDDLREVLLAQSAEMDRLRADVDEMRSKLPQ